MENCLVKKLKRSVDNDNLLVFGTLRFTVLNNQELFLAGVEEVSINGNGHFCSDNTFSDNIGKVLTSAGADSSIRAYIALDVEGVLCDLVIKDNYNISKFAVSVAHQNSKTLSGDFSQFNYRQPINIVMFTDENAYGDMNHIDVSALGAQQGQNYGLYINNKDNNKNNIKFNIEKLSAAAANPSFKELRFHNSKAYGNISALSGCTFLENIYLHNTDVAGDISSLAELTNLTWLSLYINENVTGNIESLYKLTKTTRLLFSNTSVTGTIEGLAEGMLAQGKTTEVQVTAKNTTFHGVELANNRLSLNFGTGTVTVRQTNSTGVVLGTYANGTWTYA